MNLKKDRKLARTTDLKRLKGVAAAMLCLMMISACTKSNIVAPEPETGEELTPDFNLYNNILIDDEQLHEDVADIYIDEEDEYPMAKAIDFGLHLDEGYVDIIAVVKDGTTAKDAAFFATVAIKGVNDQVAVQDYSYGESDEYTFGGLYQDNEIHLKVYEASQYAAGAGPFYELIIPADEYVKIEIPEVK